MFLCRSYVRILVISYMWAPLVINLLGLWLHLSYSERNKYYKKKKIVPCLLGGTTLLMPRFAKYSELCLGVNLEFQIDLPNFFDPSHFYLCFSLLFTKKYPRT